MGYVFKKLCTKGCGVEGAILNGICVWLKVLEALNKKVVTQMKVIL
jgi:hypothetical protein